MSRTAMRVSPEGGSSRKRGGPGAFPALFPVVVIVFMLLVTVAGYEHGNNGGPGPSPNSRCQSRRPPSSLPRKVIPFMHAPPPRGRKRKNKDGEPESLYDEDKRIIHTGPNPLHN